MKTISSNFVLVAILLLFSSNLVTAQEVCFTDATEDFKKWRSSNGKTLDELSAKFEASADPFKENIVYDGMTMPIAAALIIEGEAYGKKADAQMTKVVGDAKECSGRTTIQRGTYDLARDWLGITTILPEKATRIDFEELQRGNFAGGKSSFIRTTGRDIDKALNPFRW